MKTHKRSTSTTTPDPSLTELALHTMAQKVASDWAAMPHAPRRHRGGLGGIPCAPSLRSFWLGGGGYMKEEFLEDPLMRYQ